MASSGPPCTLSTTTGREGLLVWIVTVATKRLAGALGSTETRTGKPEAAPAGGLAAAAARLDVRDLQRRRPAVLQPEAELQLRTRLALSQIDFRLRHDEPGFARDLIAARGARARQQDATGGQRQQRPPGRMRQAP